MATYLLAWNPDKTWGNQEKWHWSQIAENYNKTALGEPFLDLWRTSNRKIRDKDRIFIVKVGKPPRGIFAEGYADGIPRKETPSEVDGKARWCVPIRITKLFDPDAQPILMHSDLKQISATFPWMPPGSGILIPSEIEDSLKLAWSKLFPDNTSLLADLDAIATDPNLTITQRETLTKARIGQGKFRDSLLGFWGSSCAVTGVKNINMLRASHIKPWRSSNDAERLDQYNGLLLIPNLDQAFDQFLISFADDGLILVSPKLHSEERQHLGIFDSMRLRHVSEQHKKYLAYHREKFLTT